MNEVFFSLGSNMGNRAENLSLAAELISLSLGTGIMMSSVFETAPWGRPDQAFFLNQVIKVNICMPDPQSLLLITGSIEKKMGRERLEKWGPRVIDIDILFYKGQIIHSSTLQIPHPGIPGRLFVLAPMVELAPDLIHPELLKTMKELYDVCPDSLIVNRLSV